MFLELDIETLTFGGRGLGRHNGKAVFVPGTAPGDRISCRLTQSHRQFDEAELCTVLEPSPVRRTPPCPVADACGGCQWQHLPYAEQLRWKERLFHEHLLRNGIAPHDRLLPIVPSPAEWNYRNRVQFKCLQTRSGFISGFYRRASHHVTDTPRCLLAMAPINDCYAYLRPLLPHAPRPDAVPQIDISCSDNSSLAVLMHLLPGARHAMRGWLREKAANGVFAAAMQAGRKDSIEAVAGDTDLVTSVDEPPLWLSISTGGFSQVNPDQNRSLVKAAIVAAQLSGEERVLDLYCGVGNFTLPLARRSGQVVGIESYEPAIGNARANALRDGLGNVTFHAAPVESTVSRHGKFDLVLLDPPRTGAYPVMRELTALRPRRILYVSCDPLTLTRDLTVLVHNGYAVQSSQPFDFFPQTWHIESLTVLDRCD
jgi:23S rRNA (uracil1939-C5)-methyltransferase